MSIQKNILIMGAGPAGIMTATALAAANPNAKITVVDIRQETRRNYGLHVAKDAIEAVRGVLQKILNPQDADQNRDVRSFRDYLISFKNRVFPVKDIENALAVKAEALGVKIVRKDSYRNILTNQEGLDVLFSPSVERGLSPEEQELRELFQKADVLIGGDGKHSALRQRFMRGGDDEQITDVKNLEYFIEIKYQTPQETAVQETSDPTSISNAACQGIGFETMGRHKGEGSLKPATKHFFVGATTYEHFEEATDEKPWTLRELAQKASNDPVIENQAQKIVHYLETVRSRNGCCKQEKIKRLPITVYKSPQAVAMHGKKVVALVGDALSGAVFARGVNKAFLESAHLVETLNTFINANEEVTPDVIPEAFVQYEKAVFEIYENEKWWAEIKASVLKTARVGLRCFITAARWVLSPLIWFVSNFRSPQKTLTERVASFQMANVNGGK
jgi:2-polyprenyl-6-methoxyphenol hydroxylase-like FAD-dependent oxidoreductase